MKVYSSLVKNLTPKSNQLLLIISTLLWHMHRIECIEQTNSNLKQQSAVANLTMNRSTAVEIKFLNGNMPEDFQIPVDEMFIFMSIVYSISTLSAIVANLIVILVYLFVQRTKTDLSMFLINLAVADFLMSTVCMPFSFAQVLLERWIFGEILCPIGNNYYFLSLAYPCTVSDLLFIALS